MKNQHNIQVAIVDDNQELCDGLYHFIHFSPGFEVVGQYASALRIVEKLANNRPDVVLMDIDMPEMNGIDAVKRLKNQFPAIHVLMLTVFEDEERVFEALQAGATGYLLKKTSPQKILEAIEDIMAGGAPMTPSIARKVVHFFSRQSRPDYQLTPKESAVLRFLVKGLSYKLISAEMEISIDTVRTHLKNIYQKLHVNSNTEAIIKAIQHKIV